MRRAWRNKTAVALGLLLSGALSACQTADQPPGDYPSLNTVPEATRAGTPIEERRQIVRDLIGERDRTRTKTAVIRDRSGLAADIFPDPAEEEIRAEDVVLDSEVGSSDPFRLTPDSEKIPADSVYRSESRIEDGGLDDFIRQLKRDTSPSAPKGGLDPEGSEDDETSFLTPNELAPAGFAMEETSPVWLSAFAPAALAPAAGLSPPVERDLRVRLAAAEDEPGFFCGWLGWSVAWSNMCVPETGVAPEQEGDEQGVVADVEPESGDAEGARSTRSRSGTSEDARQERTERRLSEEDASEALEEAGRSVLAPVASSLEKLRNFIRERRAAGTTSTPPRTESVDSLRPASPSSPLSSRSVDLADPPAIPVRRPERREDVTIVDQGKTFEFHRTPRPAFKPLPNDQALVILPPETSRRETRSRSVTDRLEPPPRPSLRPSDLSPLALDKALSARDIEPGDALDDETIAFAMPADANLLRAPDTLLQTPVQNEAAPTTPDASAGESQVLAKLPTPAIETLDAAALAAGKADADPRFSDSEPVFIRFEPDAQTLPVGALARLDDLLAQATSENRKIHIIGEAGSNHLAKRRATDVGAALVKLGATVERLEYDHDAKDGADQVRLVLRSPDQNTVPSGRDRTAVKK